MITPAKLFFLVLFFSFNSFATERPALLIRATCEISCAGSAHSFSTFSAPGTFYPKTSLRKEANGGLSPLLTQRLTLLADELCTQTAIQACGRAENIQHLKPIILESGSWRVKLPLTCSRQMSYSFSPYDSQFKKRIAKAPTSLTLDQYTFRFSSIERFDFFPYCQHFIHATSCFGDCLSEKLSISKKKFVETLSTPEYIGTESVQICADPLLSWLDQHPLPRALRPMACRRYFLEKIITQNSFSNSCAALRFNYPECDQL